MAAPMLDQETESTAVAVAQPEVDQRTRQVMQLVGGDRARAEKVLRVAANAVQKVPALASVDKGKLWMAILDVASMNLPFGPRGAYLVPYQNDVTVIISPHGLIEMAYRHPLVKSIQARVVRAGEPFRVTYAPEAVVFHDPTVTDVAGEMIGAYAIIDLTTGGRIVEWMTRAEIMKVKAVSRSANGGGSPWRQWEEEMWRKTVLKRAMKYVPQSEDMMRAFDREDSDADFEVVTDSTTAVNSAMAAPVSTASGSAGVRERLAAKRQQASEPTREREPGEEG